MWMLRELTRHLGDPFEVLENPTTLEVWCHEHGRIGCFSAAGAAREELVKLAERHRRAYHCGDA